MFDVKGKWALITGANRGIGEQITNFMAQRGANLILHSRNLEHTAELEAKIKGMGLGCVSFAAELSDLCQVEKMLDEIEASGIQTDIIFNNAAVQIAYRNDYFKTPVSDFQSSFVINTMAPAMICYRLMPPMIERGYGRIINTTSGIKNEPQQAGYSASKAALDKFTTDLATVVDGTDVILSLSDPGWCRTDLGGPHAPNSVESSIPGVVVGAFVDDKISGRLFTGPGFDGMTLEESVEKAKTMPTFADM